ncbi:MAG: hypothetical protein U9O87_01925 [Verrucomicrobiota bacterium]|nr:hypothetical protein [Verrucomicrobiota bacterium]
MKKQNHINKLYGLTIFMELVLLAIIISASCFMYIKTKNNINKLSRNIEKKKIERQRFKNEVENLNLKLEQKKSGSYIYSAIERWKLDLRQAQPGAVRRITPRSFDK